MGVYRSVFLEQLRQAIRVRHYSIRTEQAYVDWTRRFILFHRKRHPRDMGEAEICAFLTHLAIDRKVSASTQNQALNALVFTYKTVLQRSLGNIDAVRAKKPQKLPVVLTKTEVKRVLAALDGYNWMACCLLYGSGLRLMECIRLRVKELDFDHRAIIVRDGKGGKDRVVTLPDGIVLPLQRHLGAVKNTHDKDLADGFGEVYLPHALARKYPNAPIEWGWLRFSCESAKY